MDLILASTSPYRRRLLERLQISFRCVPPEVDESRLPGEDPRALALRLAQAKARFVATLHPSALVIGSDQVASLDGRCIGKPGNYEAAAAQLRCSSGKRVDFHTGIALVCHDRHFSDSLVVPFSVQFRPLSDAQIDNYLHREQPYDCAGSFKCEGLGIALFERMIGDDPTALEGLPLIALSALLSAAGLAVL